MLTVGGAGYRFEVTKSRTVAGGTPGVRFDYVICGFGADFPRHTDVELVVQCSDGRQRTAEISGTYSTATEHVGFGFPSTDAFLFPGADADSFYVMSGGILVPRR